MVTILGICVNWCNKSELAAVAVTCGAPVCQCRSGSGVGVREVNGGAGC